MQFSGRQDKDNILSWLLKSLQKRIEGSRRQHMDLVNNIDLVTC